MQLCTSLFFNRQKYMLPKFIIERINLTQHFITANIASDKLKPIILQLNFLVRLANRKAQ